MHFSARIDANMYVYTYIDIIVLKTQPFQHSSRGKDLNARSMSFYRQSATKNEPEVRWKDDAILHWDLATCAFSFAGSCTVLFSWKWIYGIFATNNSKFWNQLETFQVLYRNWMKLGKKIGHCSKKIVSAFGGWVERETSQLEKTCWDSPLETEKELFEVKTNMLGEYHCLREEGLDNTMVFGIMPLLG